MSERKDVRAHRSPLHPLASGILPHMQKAFGLSTGQSGLLTSSNYPGYLLGAVLLTLLPAALGGTFAPALLAAAGTVLTGGLILAIPALGRG